LANNLTASLCRQEFHRACPIAETLAEHGLREFSVISLIFFYLLEKLVKSFETSKIRKERTLSLDTTLKGAKSEG
jgi:hypothetical protein